MTRTQAKPLWRGAYSEERAQDYANLLRTGLGPIYRTVLDTVAECLRLLTSRRRLRILDLGAGTGNVTERLLKEFPSSSVLCLDGSPEMLGVARRRFETNPKVSFLEADFGGSDWPEHIGRFDAVVSTGAVHHLDDSGKAALFRRILGLLEGGGVFICGDQLRGEGPLLDRVYEDAWVRLIQRNLSDQGQAHSLDFIRRRHRLIQSSEGDQPARLAPQLKWLREAGFIDVDCFWKYFAFALFGGLRP